MANTTTDFSNTRLTTKETFIWTIDNFSKRLQNVGDHVESNIFRSSSLNSPLKWGQIRFHLFKSKITNNDASKERALIALKIGTKKEIMTAHLKLLLRQDNERDSTKFIARETKCPNKCLESETIWISVIVVKRNVLMNARNGLITDDRLTIVGNVTIEEESLGYGNVYGLEISVPDNRIVVDMGHLFEKSLFTDFVFIASDGKEFKVHKCILASRSPVFAAMLGHEMSETLNGTVKIEDFSSDVLEQMLRFIYSGLAPKLAEMAEELLEAADKYKLDRLKLLCERELAQSMSNANACELMVLADRHSAAHLKANAFKYIQQHANEVLKSDGWKMLIKRNVDGDLFHEMMKALFTAPK